jgi:hypothetical protein
LTILAIDDSSLAFSYCLEMSGLSPGGIGISTYIHAD